MHFFFHPKQSTSGDISTPPLIPNWPLSARTQAGERTNLIICYNQASNMNVSLKLLISTDFIKAVEEKKMSQVWQTVKLISTLFISVFSLRKVVFSGKI